MVPRPTLVKFFTGKSGKTVCSASISVWAIAALTWEHHSLSVFWNWKDFPTINHTPALPKANICAVIMAPDCGRDHGFHPKRTLSARSQDPDPLSATLSPWDSNRIILSNRYVQQNVGFSSICYSLRVAFSPLVFSPTPHTSLNPVPQVHPCAVLEYKRHFLWLAGDIFFLTWLGKGILLEAACLAFLTLWHIFILPQRLWSFLINSFIYPTFSFPRRPYSLVTWWNQGETDCFSFFKLV